MTVPILLSILTSDETEVLETSLLETVRQFGFDVIAIGEPNMRLFGKTVWWLFGNEMVKIKFFIREALPCLSM